MKSVSVSTLVILLLVALAAFAQDPQELFMNAGLRPSGYIDFSGLPAPAAFRFGSSPSTPVTATLPVSSARKEQ